MQRRRLEHSYASVPWPVPDEIARPALISRLAERWTVPVTVVVAGAGFGKSTALAQAFRTDQLMPSGQEGWVSIQPGLEHADFLCAEILSALGVDHGEDARTDLLRAIRDLAPVEVSLIIDDVHKIPPASSSAQLLSDLVTSLPANAHLVLAGRSVESIALSRLRAAGGLREITERDLCFTSAECAQLAASVGRDPVVGAPYGGWPALLRLSLCTSTATAAGFVQEEVLAGLAEPQRLALFALATVGSADATLTAQICDVAVDLADLAVQVPLVVRAGETDYRAHDLWSEVLVRALAPSTVERLRARAVAALTERGDLFRAGSLAIRHADWQALEAVALELVKTTMMSLPVDTAVGWLEQVPADRRCAPELRLLAAAVECSQDYTLPSTDRLIDGAAADFRRQNNRDAELVAITLGILAAGSRYDDERTDVLYGRVTSAQHQDEPADPLGWRFARGNAAAALAEIRGEPELALDHLEQARLAEMPLGVTRSSYRLLMRCLLLAGRAQEAAELAEATLTGGDNHHLAHVPAFARWIGGDPSGFLQEHLVTAYERGMDSASSRDAFIGGMVHAVVAASWGLRSDLGRQQIRAALSVAGPHNARDAAFMTNARVADAIAAHDEPGGRRLLEEFVAAHPVTSPPAERHLRRFLALGYVLNETLRSWWDAAPLGHCHLQARGIARALVGARSGNRALASSCAATPATIFAVLPLPWSVELACHLGAIGQRQGSTLIEWLVEHVGAAARDELRRVAESHPTLAVTARAFLGQIPVEPSAQVQIEVLGPLAVRVDGAGIGRTELRRTRVCELLSMLVLEPEITRERLVDLLWPELPPGSGTANLRVTLAHLRRLLEPERAAGEACFYLRSDAVSVRLVRTANLRVDLWQWQRLIAESDSAYRRGDVRASIDLSLSAAGLWRGDPLGYLRRFEHFEAQLERIERTQVAALLRTGELLVARGSVADAVWLAEQALRCDPYSEQAHRLAIAAHLGRGDSRGAHDAARRALEVLAELGVRAERGTEVLLRRALGHRRPAAA